MSVSKNNFTNKMEQNAHRVPHYGIRKLSVGVASVLLGTTLYFGGVAHADVINGNDSNTANPQPQEEQEVNKDSAVTQNAQNVQKKTVALSQGHQKEVGGESSTSLNDAQKTEDKNIVNQNDAQEQNTSLQVNDLVQSSGENLNEQKTEIENDSGIVIPENQDGKANQKSIGTGTSASVSLSDGSTLSVDNDQLDATNQTATLTFQSAAFKTGDKYTIKIPRGGGIYLDTNNVPPLQLGLGKTEVTSDDNYYTITNTFTSTGTVTQQIKLEYVEERYAPVTKVINNIILSHDNDQAVLKENYISDNLSISVSESDVPKYSINGDEVTYKETNVSFPRADIKNFKSLSAQIKLPKYFTPSSVSLGGIEGNLNFQNGILTVEFDPNDLKKITYQDDGTTLTLDLTGKYQVPAEQFNQHNYHVEKIMAPISITVVTKNNASFTGNDYGERLADHYVIDDAKNFGEGVLHVDTDYVAGYIDNDYSNNNPITANSEIINDGHKNSSEISNLKKFSDNLNYDIENQLAGHDLKSTSVTLTVPDGINTKVATIWNSTVNAVESMQVTFTDGTQELVSNPQRFFKDASQEQEFRSSKNIRSIKLDFKEWDSGTRLRIHLGASHWSGDSPEDNAHFAENYLNGKPVQVGDLLTGKVTIDNGTNVKTLNAFYVRPVVQKGDKLGIYTATVNNQISKRPGVMDAGSMTYEAADSAFGNPHLQHPVMYIEVPDNAVANDLSNITIKTGLTVEWGSADSKVLTPKSVSVIKVDGHQIIKLDLSNYSDIRKGFSARINYGNVPDVLTSTKKSSFIVVADNLDQISLGYGGHLPEASATDDHVAIFSQLIKQGNISRNKTVYDPGADWSISTAEGQSTVTMTEGNTEAAPTMAAHQDVHKSDPDHFNIYGSIINATNSAITGATQVINIPSTADGKSQFNVIMTGPATVIDANTGKDLGDLGKLSYSTSTYDYSKGKDGITGMTYVDASKIKDWSSVKSVMLNFENGSELPKMISARVTIPVQDKNIYDHVGKSIYASSLVYSSTGQMKKYDIEPASVNSAKLTVTGQAKVKTLVKYVDAKGNEQVVELPDQTKTYQELKDEMKRTDFLQSDKDLTSIDHNALPIHLAIDYAHPTIQNSNTKYLDGYDNGPAKFGQTVKYDFDNDAVVFNAKLMPEKEEHHVVKRVIHYVYANGGMAALDKIQASKEFVRVGYQNPYTNKTEWIKNTDSDQFDAVQSPNVTGYSPDKVSIKPIKVHANDDDLEETVTYYANTGTPTTIDKPEFDYDSYKKDATGDPMSYDQPEFDYDSYKKDNTGTPTKIDKSKFDYDSYKKDTIGDPLSYDQSEFDYDSYKKDSTGTPTNIDQPEFDYDSYKKDATGDPLNHDNPEFDYNSYKKDETGIPTSIDQPEFDYDSYKKDATGDPLNHDNPEFDYNSYKKDETGIPAKIDQPEFDYNSYKKDATGDPMSYDNPKFDYGSYKKDNTGTPVTSDKPEFNLPTKTDEPRVITGKVVNVTPNQSSNKTIISRPVIIATVNNLPSKMSDVNQKATQQLPQTGNQRDGRISTVGLLFAGLAGAFGLLGLTKKKTN